MTAAVESTLRNESRGDGVALAGLIWTLVRTDFKARYHGTIGGFVWALLKPVCMFVVLMSVFSFLFAADPRYKLNLIVGLVLWDFFAEGTKNGLTSLHARGYLLTKSTVRPWILVITFSPFESAQATYWRYRTMDSTCALGSRSQWASRKSPRMSISAWYAPVASSTSGSRCSSIPPIANHGLCVANSAVARTRSRPGAGRPGLVGVGQHGPRPRRASFRGGQAAGHRGEAGPPGPGGQAAIQLSLL